ncbi:MAG: SPOR domain-containing protein [Bacteroidota bacterium]
MKKFILLLPLFYFLYASLVAQTTFSLEDLNQQPVKISKHLKVNGFKEQGDTSLQSYDATYVESLEVYQVYIEGSHPILNPNPTGLLINGQKFDFYCSPERSTIKYLSAFMDIYEFSYLGRKYICFFAFREDCVNSCRYRCYNLYDVTDPNSIQPYSFASIFSGSESFGDFNQDGEIDFVTLAPKSPESYIVSEEDKDPKSNVLITAYAMKDGQSEEIFRDNGTPYYIYVAPEDEDISAFTILQADWFIPLKDSKGETLEAAAYYPDYVPFDPMNDFIYDSRGYRVDKKNWVIHLDYFPDMEGAQEFCDELAAEDFREAYILVDQYNDITFHVLYGNYWGRKRAEDAMKQLKDKLSVNGELKNIRRDF